jgi:molybdenum cofactor biosynthesis enzyme MoaA
MMTLSEVSRHLAGSVQWGVKEYYFTGGEPFLNPEFIEIVLRTLEYGPVTVLTNASVLPDEGLRRWKTAEADSCYGLEFRVSLDGFSPETNDPIRGQGTFWRTIRGLRKLLEHGFLPLVTIVRTWEMRDERVVVEAFQRQFQAQGYARPRLKILPTIRLGAEVRRTHGYAADERVTAEMLEGFDLDQLLCHHARIVSDQGVHVCPLLIDDPAARLGDRLSEGLRPVTISAAACHTCYQHGAICSNFAR